MRRGSGYWTVSEEELQAKPYDSKLAIRLAGYLKPHTRLLLASLAVLVLDSLLDIAGPYLTKVAIDEHIRFGDLEGLNRVVFLFLGTVLTGSITQFLRVYMLQLTGQKALLELREQVFNKLLAAPQSFYDRTPMGKLVSRAVQDVEVIQELFTQGVIVVLGDLMALLAITVALFWMDWRLALVTLCVAPPLALATALYRSKAREAYRQLRHRVAQLNAFLQESLSGVVTVQLLGLQHKRTLDFDELNRQTREQNLRSIKYSSVFFPFVEVMAATALGLILWYGGGRVLQEHILPGVLVAFIQYVKRLFQPIRDLAEKYNLLQAAMASSERVFGLLDSPWEGMIPPARPSRRTGLGAIEAQDLWFSYQEGEWVLKDVEFSLKPGESMAIVGATGAGKSSLIGLFNRSYEPNRGRIILDGRDIRDWPLGELRRHVGVVPQDVFLFRGSMLDNLRLWDQSIDLQKVRRMAREFGLEDWIQSLPEGYLTPIGERGRNLSLGQRQLVAFMRIMLYDPRVIVLDEATSSVDPATEALIQEALGRMALGRTCIVIAHRLSTVQEANRILVLHKGRILEQGTHSELLAQRGMYQHLYRLQWGSEAWPR